MDVDKELKFTSFFGSAGTGKTTSLLNNLEAGDLCLSFTRSSTREIKNRVDYKIKDKVEIFTIHSFANSIVELDKENFIDANSWLKQEYNENKKVMVDFNKLYGLLNLEKANIKQMCDKLNLNLNLMATTMEQYLNYKLANFKYDFFDLVKLAIKEKNNIKLYNSIHIDEAQDLSLFLWDFIKIIPKKKKLFLYGDDDQAIFKFAGSTHKIMMEANKSIFLDKVYRHSFEITHMSQNLVKRFCKDRKTKDNLINDKKIGFTSIKRIEKLDTKTILPYLMKPEKVAIITRTKYDYHAIKNELVMLGYPFTVIGTKNYYNGLYHRIFKLIQEKKYETIVDNNMVDFLKKPIVASYKDNPYAGFCNTMDEVGTEAIDMSHFDLNEINYINKMLLQRKEAIKNPLVLTTIHKAKGLEFDTVFLQVDTLSKKVKKAILKDSEAMENEARVLFTGITRTIKRLFIVGDNKML